MNISGRIKLFFIIVMTIMASVSYAEMAIYFKDGREVQVLKIVFKGQQAELYKADGTVFNVAVSTIDLDSSGIPSPAGTYGETRMTRPAPAAPRPALIANSPLRQAELRDEWEKATIIAVARRDVGSIRGGDTVHAYTPASSDSYKSSNQRSEYYWYDDDRQEYWRSNQYQPPVTRDHGYIIIYKKTDGIFGKKIIDATGFSDNFEIQKSPTSSAPPLHPVPPEPVSPPALNPSANDESQGLQEQQQETTGTTGSESVNQTSERPAEGDHEVTRSARRRNLIPFALLAFVVLATFSAVLFFLLKGRQTAFIDSSKFAQYERDLQDFELEIWLRHGKTIDQLMDICVKKFYQENPTALNIANRVLKGTPKNFLVPLIAKEANLSSAHAETIYAEMQARIDTIRRLIDSVSKHKGLRPRPAVEAVPAPLIQPVQQAAKSSAPPPPTVMPPAAVVPHSQVKQGASSAIEISVPIPERAVSPKRNAARGLPSYAADVLDQLSFLTEEK